MMRHTELSWAEMAGVFVRDRDTEMQTQERILGIADKPPAAWNRQERSLL